MGTCAPFPRAPGSSHSPAGLSSPSWLRGGGLVSLCPWSCWQEAGSLSSGPLDGTGPAAQPKGPLTCLSSVCSGASSRPAGQDATCSHDAPWYPGVPPNHGQCPLNISEPHRGPRHLLLGDCSGRGPHGGLPGTSPRPRNRRGLEEGFLLPPPQDAHTPAQTHTRPRACTPAHTGGAGDRCFQGPPRRSPGSLAPLAQCPAAAVSSPPRGPAELLWGPQPPAHGATGL